MMRNPNNKTANRCLLHFFFVIFSLILAQTSHAATVKKVNTAKKYVVVEKTSDSNFERGNTVCFHSESGKRVACGKVGKVSKSSIFVRVSAKRIASVKVGFTAKIRPPKGAVVDKKPSTETPAIESSQKKVFAIRGVFLPSFVTPWKYNNITYDTPRNDTFDSLWANEGTISQSLLTFGGEVESPMIGLLLGFRMSMFKPLGHDADFDPTNGNIYFDAVLSASSLGFYLDYTGLRFPIVPGSDFIIAGGVDIDLSTVKFEGTRINLESGQDDVLYDITSSLQTISLRISPKYELHLGSIQISSGLSLLVPLSGQASLSGIQEDPNLARIEDGEQDLITSLGHQKTSFAAQFILGFGLAF
jgi:hypothetical protein